MSNAAALEKALLAPYRRNRTFGYDVQGALIAVWVSNGATFQHDHDIETDEGLDKLMMWWLGSNRHDFAGVRDLINEQILSRMHRPDAFCDPSHKLKLTPLQQLVLRDNVPIAKAFDTRTAAGISRFWYWWLSTGLHEFFNNAEELLDQAIDTLHVAYLPRIASARRPILTPLQQIVLAGRSDITDKFDVTKPDTPSKFWQWWLTADSSAFFSKSDRMRRKELELLHLKHLPKVVKANGGSLTPFLELLTSERHDLWADRDHDNPAAIGAIWYWWIFEERKHLPDISETIKKEIEELHLAHLSRIVSAPSFILSPLLRIIMNARPDLAACDVEISVGIAKVWCWWIFEGYRNLREDLSEALKKEIEELHLAHLSRIVSAPSFILSPLLRIIIDARPDLAAHDVETSNGVAKVWCWWFCDGQKQLATDTRWIIEAEYAAFHRADLSNFWTERHVAPTFLVKLLSPEVARQGETLSAEQRATQWNVFFGHFMPMLSLPHRGLPVVSKSLPDVNDVSDGLKRLVSDWMPVIYTMRPDLQTAFNLADDTSIVAFVRWFFTYGLLEYSLIDDPFGERVRTVLETPVEPSLASLSPNWSGWLYRLAHPQNDLSGRSVRKEVQTWWRSEGRMRFAEAHRLLMQDRRRNAAPVAEPAAQEMTPPPERKKRPQPIALIGYAKGELGIGEDIRLLRRSLQTVGIEPAVINAPWNIESRQAMRETFEEATESGFMREVMFYAIPPSDSLTLLQKSGPKAFAAARRIGFWQWEMPNFQPPFTLATSLISEIWCHSEHSARAFRAATDKPVIKVPLPVAAPDTPAADRRRYGIPKNAFTIFTSFDGLSSISRKNPLGAIVAFQKAFPKSDRSVRLFIKCMNVREARLWNESQRNIALDSRIIVLPAVLDRLEYYKLLRACDAVLSLHRAEGFGRLMAESMALGIPTIATAWSGNLDFMTAENSWLVGGELVPVFNGDYPFFRDQQWLEPDVDRGAAALRERRDAAKLRRSKARAGTATIPRQYSLEVCGRRYLELLGDSFRQTIEPIKRGRALQKRR